MTGQVCNQLSGQVQLSYADSPIESAQFKLKTYEPVAGCTLMKTYEAGTVLISILHKLTANI